MLLEVRPSSQRTNVMEWRMDVANPVMCLHRPSHERAALQYNTMPPLLPCGFSASPGVHQQDGQLARSCPPSE
jgi:hypothetical protein